MRPAAALHDDEGVSARPLKVQVQAQTRYPSAGLNSSVRV